MRVLLIDDSSTMRKIQKKVISSIPGVVDILEASNGKEALELLQKENFNFRFVLCDINMPEMSGIETLKAIRSHPIGSKLPVIMCTSVAEKSQVLEAIKAGANNYVVKPFKPEDLQAKIMAVLEKTGGTNT